MMRDEKRVARSARRSAALGFTTITVMFLLALAFLTVFVMAGASLSQIRASSRGQNRAIELGVAEAGIDDKVERLAAAPDTFGPTATNQAVTFPAVTVHEDPATRTRPLGQYQTTMQWMDKLNRKLTSRAVRAGNATGTEVVAYVKIKEVPLGSGALQASHLVDINGGATIQTQDPLNPTAAHPDKHLADVLSNGNITMGGSSYVDGKLSAGGTATGTAFYPSESGSYTLPYPSPSTTEQWRLDYLAAAKAGDTRNAVRGTATIMAPAYINGGISISSSEVVRFTYNPALNPEKNIVYVDGDIKLSGQSTLINGVTLVVAGSFDQSGGTTYRIFGSAEMPIPLPGLLSPNTPTLMVFGGTNPSPIDRDVISLTGGSGTQQQGIIYAVNGDIKVAGGATIVGSLVAGGVNGSIGVTGNYNHWYPEGMKSLIKFYTGAEVEKVAELQKP